MGSSCSRACFNSGGDNLLPMEQPAVPCMQQSKSTHRTSFDAAPCVVVGKRGRRLTLKRRRLRAQRG